jgi:hypothetical protein
LGLIVEHSVAVEGLPRRIIIDSGFASGVIDQTIVGTSLFVAASHFAQARALASAFVTAWDERNRSPCCPLVLAAVS